MTANHEIIEADADTFEHVSKPSAQVVATAGQSMVARQDQASVPAPAAITPMAMIDRALAANASPDTLERLLALQERWEASQARKAFDEAMAAAKAEFAPIITNRRVAFEGKNGKADTNYKFEDMAQIERQIGPILSKQGLSYRFKVEAEIEQPVRVTCIVAHRDGHFEQTTLAAGRDTSGNKNHIQAVGSAVTYLQRYTLKAALGLAVAHDDDGKSGGADSETITEEQAAAIRSLIDETGTDIARFCDFLKVDAIPDIPASQFGKAMQALEAKRRKSA